MKRPMMNKQNVIAVSILCLGAMLGAPRIQCAQDREQKTPASKRVAYCSILAQSAKYDHRILKTEGIYGTGMEFSGFYSLSCPEWRKVSWVDYSDGLRKHTSPALFKRMERLLDADGRARVVAVLKFDGPKPVKIPPGTPPAIAASMRATNSRYGHMNQFNYRVVLLRIINAESVPSDAPWPARNKGTDPSQR